MCGRQEDDGRAGGGERGRWLLGVPRDARAPAGETSIEEALQGAGRLAGESIAHLAGERGLQRLGPGDVPAHHGGCLLAARVVGHRQVRGQGHQSLEPGAGGDERCGHLRGLAGRGRVEGDDGCRLSRQLALHQQVPAGLGVAEEVPVGLRERVVLRLEGLVAVVDPAQGVVERPHGLRGDEGAPGDDAEAERQEHRDEARQVVPEIDHRAPE